MRKALAGRVRLQKYLSDAGVASRRHAEELITNGLVLVNDRVVDELPAFVNPLKDKVIANGVPVRPQRLEYFIVHKPKGIVCSNDDPGGRMRAIDLLPDLPMPLFPVGRLDVDSTGLLLMTNDGELAQRITHPRFGIPKTYRAEVRGEAPADLPARMRKGIHLAEGKAQASEVEIIHASRQRSVLMITLREGRNRQVRRMLARLGFPVKTLKRVQIGPLSLKSLPVGASRRLSTRELESLKRELERADASATAPRSRSRRSTPDTRGDRKRRPASSSKAPLTSREGAGEGRRKKRKQAPASKRSEPKRAPAKPAEKPPTAPKRDRKPPDQPDKPRRRLIT